MPLSGATNSLQGCTPFLILIDYVFHVFQFTLPTKRKKEMSDIEQLWKRNFGDWESRCFVEFEKILEDLNNVPIACESTRQERLEVMMCLFIQYLTSNGLDLDKYQ
jgi:hypothetical protein